MSSNYDGVIVTLAGEEKELVPSPGAALQISRKYNGFGSLLARLANYEADVYNEIVRAGLGYAINSKEAGKVPEMVYNTGYVNLLVPLTDFVQLLVNGGMKEPDGSTDAGEEKAARGNPSA